MAPPEKVTAEQKGYLVSLVDGYLEVKKSGGLAKYWTSTFQGWFSCWPEVEDQSILNEETRKANHVSAIDAKQQYIKTWFRNHAVRKSNKQIEPKAEKITRKTPTTFGATKPDEKLRLKVIRGEVKKAFDLESKEFQAAMVAKHKKILADRAAKKKEGEVKEVPTPESYDAGIDTISTHFNKFTKEVQSSGWSFVLLCGGPDPRNGGRINTAALHCGENLLGLSIARYDPDFRARHMPAFANFLNTCYTPEDCDARGITSPNATVVNCADSRFASRFSSSPPAPVIQRVPAANVVQQASTANVVQQVPAANVVQQVPAANVVQQAPTANVVQQAPTATVIQQAPAVNEQTLGKSRAAETMGANMDMDYAWEGFDFNIFNMPNFGDATSATNGGMDGGFQAISTAYPSLMQELTTPFPNIVPNFTTDNHPLLEVPYSFSMEEPTIINHTPFTPAIKSVAPGTSTIAALESAALESAALSAPSMDPALPVLPIESPSEAIVTAPATQASPVPEAPALQAHEDIIPTNPADASLASNGPLLPVNGSQVKRKRCRDEADPKFIVTTKRARKSFKRTEIVVITEGDKVPKGKENRRPRRKTST